MARETLNRDKVLDAALLLAGEHGMAGLSMRKLAAHLGIEAMSLYNHVSSKGDLLDGMAARVFESVTLPDPTLPWADRLRLLALGLHEAFAAHPAVVRALTSQGADPRSAGALHLIDALLGALLDAGLNERDAARGYRSIMALVLGSALTGTAEVAGDASTPGAPRDWLTGLVDPATMPNLHRVLPALADPACTQDLGHQLDILINGLDAR